ncbi:unnamed protein product [Spodoptera littoralis]|uniref:Uncharacterized protein n=1 Tax=Spodoptera littoralis TaxID=7109 RepID=A0A9P0IDE3_SPOLI|nr:unnamed protein product [Spodoptera littoralis]CAH1645807.1 unnamed protein product [Spodoptera littoralis]
MRRQVTARRRLTATHASLLAAIYDTTFDIRTHVQVNYSQNKLCIATAVGTVYNGEGNLPVSTHPILLYCHAHELLMNTKSVFIYGTMSDDVPTVALTTAPRRLTLLSIN